MREFRMPSLGADMVKGTLVEWRVAAGDRVARGQVICEVETEKGVIEVEVWEDGVVRELRVGPGTVVPVGDVLAVIAAHAETALELAPTPVAPALVPSTLATAAPPLHAAPVAAASVLPPPRVTAASVAERRITPAARARGAALGIDPARLTGSGPGGAVTAEDVESAARAAPGTEATPSFPHDHATPLARRIAEAHGLDLSTVEGTGVHGSVTRADLERALTATPEPPDAGQAPRSDDADRLIGLRAAIAAAMARSKREIPHYYLSETVDVTATLAWMERYNSDRPPAERLLFTAVLMRAVAHAASEVPGMNGRCVDGRYEASEAVHLGVAIAMRDGGVITPALRDAHARTVSETMDGLRDLVARARRGKLRASEMMDGTLTLTALGELGAEAVTGVIYPPQVALVGCGRVHERAWAHEGLLGVRSVVQLSLAADHRVSDGIIGSRFLLAIRRRLEQPEEA